MLREFLTIAKCFINSKCKRREFLSLIPWCNFYSYNSCSFPAECYFQGSQFMHFRSEQCFGNSPIWLKKYKTLSEVPTWRPRNARNDAHDHYSSSFLPFLLQEQKHFNDLSGFFVLMLNYQRCLILSLNSTLWGASLRLWSAPMSWEGAASPCCEWTSGLPERHHHVWLAAV